MDKFWENYITTRPDNSEGAFDAFKQMNKEPRSMAQEPRNMELAKASPWDYTSNVNNPGLEQTEVLRPGETLEEWEQGKAEADADRWIDEADDFAYGGRVPLDEGGISDSRVGMLWGGGIFKTIIKNLAKARGVTPSDYLKITNYKALPKEVKKYMSEADFNKMKAGRIEMFENWVNMAQTRKSFMENIKQGKKNEFAAPIFEHLEKSFKSPVPSGVTDKDILQGEFILKNLKTKGRKLNASGGLAHMLGE